MQTTTSPKAGERTPRYEDTPIGQITERAKRDMGLIRGNVERREWLEVIHGVKYQIEVFTELLHNLQSLDAKGNLH